MRNSLRTWGLSLLAALGVQLVQGLVGTMSPAKAQYIITLPNSVVCEGQFTGYTGNGICQYPDGYYRGDILNGKRHGRGFFYYYPGEDSGDSTRSATTYEGEFRDDRPNGKGRFVYADDYRYDGDVRDGLPHGTGLFVFMTRPPSIETEPIEGEPYFVTTDWKQEEYLSRYYGGFSNGLFSGRGTLIYGQCRVYSLNGQADLRCARYDGQFRNGVPHGRGTYNNEICVVRGSQYDCIRFSGSFWGGQPNGQGTISFPDYGRCDGQFYDSTLIGKGTCRYDDGSRYTGDLRHGYPHGQGTITYADGTTESGEFRLGDPFDQIGLPAEDLSIPELEGFPRYPGRP